MKFYRHFVADRTVWTHLIVVSTPSLAFSACFVETEEPIRIQTFRSELAVQRFDEGIVGRFARTAEVERHAFHKGPEIEILADELGAVVQTYRLRITELSSRALKRLDHVASTVVLAHIDHR